MSSPRDQARAVIEQMYSAVGLSRSLGVPPIDADGLFAWAVTLDACLDCGVSSAEQPGSLPRDGWDCAWCGHRHAGQRFAYVCIGCACEQRPPQGVAGN